VGVGMAKTKSEQYFQLVSRHTGRQERYSSYFVIQKIIERQFLSRYEKHEPEALFPHFFFSFFGVDLLLKLHIAFHDGGCYY
jgi:hypothetical protein